MTPSDPILPSCVCGDPNCQIPFGLCHCGCGKETNRAEKAYKKLNLKRGQPFQYVFGHQTKRLCVPEEATPFKLRGVYCRFIRLSRDLVAIVNADQYPELVTKPWYAAWSANTKSYYAVRHTERDKDGNRGTVSMHREVCGLSPDDPMEPDHINHDTLDNARENLRLVTSQQNNWHSRLQKNNTSGYTGIHERKNKPGTYRVYITVNRKRINLGVVTSLSSAVELRNAAVLKYFGEFGVIQ